MSKPAYGIVDLIRNVAQLASQPQAGWKTYGQPGDQLQVATVRFGSIAYTLLRSEGQIHVFTPEEWSAFLGGVRDGEFNKDAGITSPADAKEKSAT
jgi:hypothetical protein